MKMMAGNDTETDTDFNDDMIMMMMMMLMIMIWVKMMMMMWVIPWPVLREESSGDEELNAALIPTNYISR